MAVRVEKDTTIYVSGTEPGKEAPRDLEISFPLSGDGIVVHSGKYGRQVSIEALRAALDAAEQVIEMEASR